MTNSRTNSNVHNEYITPIHCILKNDMDHKTNLTNKCKNSINIIKNILHNIPNTDDNINNMSCEVDVRPKFMRYLWMTVKQLQEQSSRQQKEIHTLIAETNFLKYKLVEQEEARLTVDDQCCVCLTKKKDHAFTGCGHMCVCGDCADRCWNKCPLCRSEGNYMRIIS